MMVTALLAGATNPPPTVPQFYPAQVLLSQQSDSYFMERNPRMANTFPFIPSQVVHRKKVCGNLLITIFL